MCRKRGGPARADALFMPNISRPVKKGRRPLSPARPLCAAKAFRHRCHPGRHGPPPQERHRKEQPNPTARIVLVGTGKICYNTPRTLFQKPRTATTILEQAGSESRNGSGQDTVRPATAAGHFLLQQNVGPVQRPPKAMPRCNVCQRRVIEKLQQQTIAAVLIPETAVVFPWVNTDFFSGEEHSS